MSSRAANPRRPQTQGKSRSEPRWTWFVIALISVTGSLQAVGMIIWEGQRSWTSQHEIRRLEQDISTLEADIATLEQVVIHGNDERFKEQLARANGFVYPDEKRFITVR